MSELADFYEWWERQPVREFAGVGPEHVEAAWLFQQQKIDQLTKQLKAAEEVIEAYTALGQATRAHLVEIKKHTGDPSALPTHKAMEGARARFKAKYTGYIGSNVTHMPLVTAHKEQEKCGSSST